MAAPIGFYFDFISPYGWLGAVGIERIAASHGREVDWRPMLLGVAVMQVMGLKPLLDMPLKGDYVRRDVPRTAAFLGLPYKRIDAPMTPLPPARAFLWLKARDPVRAKAFAQAVQAQHFGEGVNATTVDGLAPVARRFGLSGEEYREAVAGAEAKALLKASVDAALATGVFGSPSFVVDGELFWGHDRLDQVDKWLAKGGW